MKIIVSLLLIALLVSSNGCMTSATIKRAKGYTEEAVTPLEGDTFLQHGGISYVIQKEHPKGETTSAMSLDESRYTYHAIPPYYAFKPAPECYPFVVLTVPLDIATCPFQAIYYGWEYLVITGLGSTP